MMRGAPFALGRLSALSIAATLFLAACGGGGAQPTAAPAAQPTTAKPTTAPAASPAAAVSPAAAASPSAKPAASPAASPAAVAAAPSPSAAPAAASKLSGTIKIVSSLPRTGSSKGQSDTLVAATNARPMEMRGRQMQGWLRVDTDDVRTKGQLAKWVELGTTYARSLPAKR